MKERKISDRGWGEAQSDFGQGKFVPIGLEVCTFLSPLCSNLGVNQASYIWNGLFSACYRVDRG